MQHGLRTIVFCRSRKLCELVITYARETLKASAPHLVSLFKVCHDSTGSQPCSYRCLARGHRQADFVGMSTYIYKPKAGHK
jgi:ATP-dependent helicase YprA (DUF1998 family)